MQLWIRLDCGLKKQLWKPFWNNWKNMNVDDIFNSIKLFFLGVMMALWLYRRASFLNLQAKLLRSETSWCLLLKYLNGLAIFLWPSSHKAKPHMDGWWIWQKIIFEYMSIYRCLIFFHLFLRTKFHNQKFREKSWFLLSFFSLAPSWTITWL